MLCNVREDSSTAYIYDQTGRPLFAVHQFDRARVFSFYCRSHTDSNMIHSCLICQRSFARKSNYTRHRRLVHGIEPTTDDANDEKVEDADDDEAEDEEEEDDEDEQADDDGLTPWQSIMKCAMENAELTEVDDVTEEPHLTQLASEMCDVFVKWKSTVDALETEDDQYEKIQSRVDNFKKDGFDDREACEAGWTSSFPIVKRIIHKNIRTVQNSIAGEEEADDDDDK